MTLFVGGFIEPPETGEPEKLQESKYMFSAMKETGECKHKQDNPANNVPKGLVAKHAHEQIAANAYKATHIAHEGKPVAAPERDDALHYSEPDCHEMGQELPHPQATSHQAEAPLYIKHEGDTTGSASDIPQNNPNPTPVGGSTSEGGDKTIFNMPIRTHRNREPGTEYFEWHRERREFREAQGLEPEDWDDDETEVDESPWDPPFDGDGREQVPTRDGVPLLWERHQDYIVWGMRGTVREIAYQAQRLWNFFPPIGERFILGRLNVRLAPMHLEFLFRYLPGETGTIQQARDRILMLRRGALDTDIMFGRQAIQNPPLDNFSPDYRVPPMPGNAPPDWERNHDAMLHANMAKHPTEFLEDCGDFLENGACLEFLQIRMAQCMHLGITAFEQRIANSMIMANREIREWQEQRQTWRPT